jgi:hypothetical protein
MQGPEPFDALERYYRRLAQIEPRPPLTTSSRWAQWAWPLLAPAAVLAVFIFLHICASSPVGDPVVPPALLRQQMVQSGAPGFDEEDRPRSEVRPGQVQQWSS